MRLRLCATALCAGVIATAAVANEIRVVNLRTNDIIHDPLRGTLYASIPSTAGSIGNTITGLDPFSGSTTFSTFVGSEPSKLAISGDSQFLYAGLDGAAAVSRLDLATRTLNLWFSLGADPFTGPYYVEDIAVLPGMPRSVAISRRNLGFSPRHEGVAIYDDNVRRLNVTPSHTGSNVIEFSASAARLYGYNNETSEFGFRRMDVDANGVRVVDTTPNLITGYSADIVYEAGRVYATNGRVIDPENRVVLGTFAASGLVRPDASVGRVFFLSGSGGTRTLTAFDINTFIPLGSFPVPGVSGTAGGLVRWGSDGLAFRTNADQVFLIRSSLVPEPGTVMALAALPAFLAARRRGKAK